MERTDRAGRPGRVTDPRAQCRRAAGPRSLPVLGLALLLALWPAPAHATWNGPQDIVQSTAHTLEQGSFSIGLFSPFRYGVLDDLQISTHPILNLLLTPNVALRGRLHEGVVAVALQAGYQQTFLERRGDGFPGMAHGELVVSVTATPWLSLSASSGYAWAFFPTEHRVPMTGTVHLLFDHAHLITLQVLGVYEAESKLWKQPNFTLTYAYGWNSFYLSGGLSVGRYTFLPWDEVSLEVDGVPLAPVFDLWWRF